MKFQSFTVPFGETVFIFHIRRASLPQFTALCLWFALRRRKRVLRAQVRLILTMVNEDQRAILAFSIFKHSGRELEKFLDDFMDRLMGKLV